MCINRSQFEYIGAQALFAAALAITFRFLFFGMATCVAVRRFSMSAFIGSSVTSTFLMTASFAFGSADFLAFLGAVFVVVSVWF